MSSRQLFHCVLPSRDDAIAAVRLLGLAGVPIQGRSNTGRYVITQERTQEWVEGLAAFPVEFILHYWAPDEGNVVAHELFYDVQGGATVTQRTATTLEEFKRGLADVLGQGYNSD